ncbi:hypothetical protein evm_003465 [Chilo suppressalis]|nr:hypothetical protein evm_003465 [Chilo suppressalis]
MARALIILFLVPIVTSKMVTLEQEDFGSYKGETVKRFIWTSESGFSVAVISYGATIQSIQVPDKNGVIDDVILGFDDLDGYVNRNSPYLGSTVGRCANRIGGASFDIDGVTYQLAKNVDTNHLHGGIVGFDKVNWQSTVDGNKVTFSYLSKDGEEGYPGDLLTNIAVEVLEDDTLRLVFQSTTTKKTVVNLTNHAYFNLAGHGTGAAELYNHVISMNANKITETNNESIPTGSFKEVGGTPFDLRVPTRLGDVIENSSELFDNNFCIANYGDKQVTFTARVTHPASGRFLEVFTDQPGVQLYTANFLPSPQDEALVGKESIGYRRHGAFCLETQNYPDAVNHDNFPSAILKPGDVYLHRVSYRFGVVKSA